MGWISKVDEDTQAAQFGVKPGSTIMYLNEVEYTEEALKDLMAKRQPFTAKFCRTAHPDDLFKDRWSHEYKDYMTVIIGGVAMVLAICGAIAVVLGSIIGKEVKCTGLKAIPSKVSRCGIAWLVTGSLLGAVAYVARQNRRKPFNSVLLCCSAVSFCISMVLFWLWTPSSTYLKTCPMTIAFWVLSSVGGGAIGIMLCSWYLLSKRAELGIGWVLPSGAR